jgi:dienelactone hydrolase
MIGARLTAPLIIAGLMAATAIAQPRSPLPKPTGEFAVGRTMFDWTETSRVDAESPSGHREIVVWVWYPAISSEAPMAQWKPGKWGELFWSDYRRGHPTVPDASADAAIGTLHTHAMSDAKPVDRSFPVLLFAPGLGADPLEYASVIEDVASHGFVVAGVASPSLARATVFADGRVVEGRGVTARSTEEAIRRFEDAASLASKDLSFALNELAKLSADGRVLSRRQLDLARVGAFGHSLGGAGVLQLGHDDARVAAIVDIDGSPIWRSTNGALGKPLLVLSASATNVGYDSPLSGAKPGLHLRVAGTAHAFSSDLRALPFAGAAVSPGMTDPARALAITASYIEAFFKRYLERQNEPLLDGPSTRFPEITFERRPP